MGPTIQTFIQWISMKQNICPYPAREFVGIRPQRMPSITVSNGPDIRAYPYPWILSQVELMPMSCHSSLNFFRYHSCLTCNNKMYKNIHI